MQRRKKKHSKPSVSIEINIDFVDMIKITKLYPSVLLLLSACQKDRTPNSMLILYDPINDYKCISKTPTKEIILSMCQVTNGNLITNSNRFVCIWIVTKESTQCLYTISQIKGENDYNFYTKVFSFSNNRFAVALYSGEVKIFKCDSPYTSTPIKLLEEHKQQVFAFSFIPETNQLLTGSIDGTLRIWNADNYQCISVIEELYPDSIFPIDSENIIAGGFRSLYIVNVKTGTVETIDLIKNAKMGQVNSILRINKEDFLCICGVYFVIFNIQSKAFVLLNFHSKDITSMIKIGENLCATGSRDKTIKIWKY